MHRLNNAALIRRELLVRTARLVWEAELPSRIDRIPMEMIPRTRSSFRCCIHKDRAVLRYRLMAILGFSVEDEEDELLPLSEYARAALERDSAPRSSRPFAPVTSRAPQAGPVRPETVHQKEDMAEDSNPLRILTVIDEACSACVRSRYFVTNACRGCFARPCTLNCPKNALSIVNGQAVIDPEKCVACGICQQACPFHAIIHIPIPCEEACPVGAITKDEWGREKIDHDKCILCGRCMRDCPFGAIMEKSQIVDVMQRLREGAPVVAMVAPAIAGQFPGTLEQVYGAILQAGFSGVFEVSRGADETTAHEAAELDAHRAAGQGYLTTSCCPSWMLAAGRHLPEILPHVSTTPSPMRYTAQAVKEHAPEAIRVFIGPCIAKKNEAAGDPLIDYVLTFEELGAIFVALEIDTSDATAVQPVLRGTGSSRGYAAAGGVAKAVASPGPKAPKTHLIDGLTRQNINLLKAWTKGAPCPADLVEVMACQGGCIAGPAVVGNPKLAAKALIDIVSK
ncbi:MAG TPA: monomeric [FeFe] hydrogenase [Spirochaetota bacterium]|nr:monomeric [FeFe] hydrogenase [Spirochaetota bacterium]